MQQTRSPQSLMDTPRGAATGGWPERLARGGVAGLTATAPMTATMLALRRALPWWRDHTLPPRPITLRVARRLGLRRYLDKPGKRNAAVLAAHFGYGAGAGALYGLIADRVPLPRLLSGILYGLLVWAGSYLGLLPVLDLLPPATRQPAERNALMIVAHVVWGAVLGVLAGARRPV